MENENQAAKLSEFNAGLGVYPVAWRRTDTPRSLITENENIARGWGVDELFYEPLYTEEQMIKMQNEISKFRGCLSAVKLIIDSDESGTDWTRLIEHITDVGA